MANQATPNATFRAVYVEELARAVEQYPDEYPWAHREEVIVGNLGTTALPRMTVEDVAARMFAAMERGTYNKDGRAFKATCKRLGIAFTYSGIAAYCASSAA